MRNHVKCHRLSIILESMTQWQRKEKRICEYERLRLKEILTRELYTPRLIDQRTSKEQSTSNRSIKRHIFSNNLLADYPFLITFDHVREESFHYSFNFLSILSFCFLFNNMSFNFMSLLSSSYIIFLLSSSHIIFF